MFSHQDITPCITAVDASNNNKHEALFSHQDITPCVTAVDAANNNINIGIVFSSRYNSCVTGVRFAFNEIQKQFHTTLQHLIVLSVFHTADSDVTVSLVGLFVTLSLVAPFVWLPSLGRKFEIILAALSTMIF